MQPKKPDSLTKLLQKKQKIEQQISNAKTRLKKVERATDTRRKILIGAYFLEVRYKGKRMSSPRSWMASWSVIMTGPSSAFRQRGNDSLKVS